MGHTSAPAMHTCKAAQPDANARRSHPGLPVCRLCANRGMTVQFSESGNLCELYVCREKILVLERNVILIEQGEELILEIIANWNPLFTNNDPVAGD
jgi:hypothetical protein